ncbi:hypothetical protein [Actinomadura sp. K4S16]|uniref:hypothetical protein n=1 Tax=Actinomadura sp. K4S16 TaxID=1316147 RepID=UPI0011F026F0|nr:hypothetical protein [Actinomadura sp. K4S16]
MGKRNPESYPIRDGMEFGSYSFGDENFDDVKNKLKSIKPESVGHASTAYKDASDVLAEMTDELRNNFAKRIVKHWQGDVAQEALDQLGQVYETSGKLSDDSHNNAQLYNWYKTSILDWYKTTGETMEDGYFNTDSDDERARELMKNYNTRMKEAFDGHPLKITKDLPITAGGGHDKPGGPGSPPGGPGSPPGGPGSPGSPPGGPGGVPLPKSDSASPFHPPGNNSPFHPGGNPNSPFHPPGNTGPYHPPGGVPGSNPFGGHTGTDLSGMPGGGPPGGGPGLGGGPGGGPGFGADPGGFGGAGAGTGSAGGPGGAFGGGAGLGGAGRAGAGMRGPMGGMPMGQGAQGGKDEERERNTWLTEDEDVWGADDDTAPPVIG